MIAEKHKLFFSFLQVSSSTSMSTMISAELTWWVHQLAL